MYNTIPSYKPLKSRCAFPGDEEAPMVYFFNPTGLLGQIQMELDWKMYDFCRLQQIIHGHIAENEKAIDVFVEQHKEQLASADENSMMYVRAREQIHAQSSSNSQTYQFSNQMTVIGLWAIAEQTMGFVYKKMCFHINGTQESDVKVPYRFNDFNKEFAKLGITLSTLDSFQDADECRTLNNTIKHGHKIEGHIVEFPYFSPLNGKLILEVDFELQRYVTGVIQFLSSLIEQGNKVLDPSHPTH